MSAFVAPLVGAWIEIECQRNLQHLLTSLLSWERGLKSFCQSAINLAYVAPLVGAWIEITRKIAYACTIEVAPLVGAWIEIRAESERDIAVAVAPLVGAWIEI